LPATIEARQLAPPHPGGGEARGSGARPGPVRVRERERPALLIARAARIDHIGPVARGGASTAENLRLLCRVHNQYAAERAFSAEFMAQKRAEAQHSPPGS
jgi:HNH endonuclease